MYQPSVRSATATTGKTAFAIVAIFSLLLSALAITRPVLATNDEGNANLTIEKSASATEVNAGDPITFTITARNTGDATATGVVITDDLSNSLHNISATFTYPDGSGDHDCTVSDDGENFVTCGVSDDESERIVLSAADHAGDYVVVTISATTSEASCDSFDNVAYIDSDVTDSTHSNTVTVHVICEDDPEPGQIVIEKDVLPETVDPSHTFGFDPSWSDDNFELGNGQHTNSGDLTPGEYTVTELDAEGFDLVHIVCDDGQSNHPSHGDLETRTATIIVEPGEIVTCTFTNAAKDEEPGEDEPGQIVIEKDVLPETVDPSHTFGFDPSWSDDNFELGNGQHTNSGDLTPGEYTVTELDAEGFDLVEIVCDDGQSNHPSQGDLETRTATIIVEPGEIVTCTFTNAAEDEEPGEEDQGTLEVIKFFCQTEGEDQIFVLGPVEDEPVEFGTLGIESEHDDDDELPAEEGCTLGADAEGHGATFTVTDDDHFEWTFTTVSNQIVEELLDVGDYTITEHGTGLAAHFEIDANEDTAVVVFNYEELEEDEGRIKIIKFFCDGLDDDVVFTIVEGQDVPFSSVDTPEQATNCDVGDAAFTLNDGETDSAIFPVGSDGIRRIPVEVGTYTLTEVLPNQDTSDEFEVTDGDTTTIIVFNLEDEDEGPGDDEMVTVSIMKHLCDDVTTVAEFEEVENAGAGGQDGGIGTVPGLVATVLACPTIVLTGDVPTSGAITNGNVDFDFAVIDSDGTQILSSDGTFEQEALCEDDVMVDANGMNGIEDDVCLDTSHYMFEVIDGTVVIYETDVPAGSTGLGTIRFTPGSEDETALATSLDVVEVTGVITLDTSGASATALSDGMIMIHAYNFAAEGTLGGNNPGPDSGGTDPDTTGTDRDGTAGGNPLPDTASSPFPTGSVPAALFALLMLSGLGAAGYAMATEARRRR